MTSSGVSALALAGEYMPSAVTLDIFLPDIDGWRVLDRLKNDDLTRHIPVSVISTDESRERALKSGAFQFAAKPMQSKEVVDALLDRAGRLLATLAPASACRVGRREQARRGSSRSLAAERRQGDAQSTSYDDGVGGDGARAGRLPRVRRRARGAAGRGVSCTKVTATARRTARRFCCTARARTSTNSITGVRLPSAPACAKCGRPSGCSSRRASACIATLASMPDAHRTALQGACATRTKYCRASGDDRRRRHAQHLRADVAARGSRHGDRVARQRPRCGQLRCMRSRTSRRS